MIYFRYDSDGSITITLHFLMSDSGEFEPLVQLASEGADWISQLRLPSDVRGTLVICFIVFITRYIYIYIGKEQSEQES